MPRYWYACPKCKEEFSVVHRMKEIQRKCRKCEHVGSLTKLVTTPLRQKRGLKTPQVGDITKQHIKANQELLEQEKKKAKKETYEPS